MFCASVEGVVCVLPQTSFCWWSQSRMGVVSLFRVSLSRSWHLVEIVALNIISLMKKVGSSVCCPYLNGHSCQWPSHSFAAQPGKEICTLLFPWGPICVCQQCPGASLAKQEGTSCAIWGCLMVAGCREQKEISKRSGLLSYPLPEDKGINRTLSLPYKAYVLRKMIIGSVVTQGWQEEGNPSA